jgi:hypothetical protein
LQLTAAVDRKASALRDYAMASLIVAVFAASLAPAVVLVMLAGMTVDKAHDQLADLFDMHPKPIQEQIDSARQYLKNHPTE